MAKNGQQDFDNLNQLIDQILQSDSVLSGEDALLYMVAAVATEPTPDAATKARILGKIHVVDIPPQTPPGAPNSVVWLAGIGLLVTLFAITAIGLSNNVPANDNDLPDLIESGSELDSIEEITIERELTEESTLQIIPPELSPEATEDVDTATASPEETAESEATQDIDVAIELSDNETQQDVSAAAEANVPVPVITMFVNSGGPVNVRNEASTTSSITTTANPNTEVTVIAATATYDWYKIILPDGSEGWIASFLLSDTRGARGEQPVNPGGSGRDSAQDCEQGNSCNSRGQSNENSGNSNGRGQGSNG